MCARTQSKNKHAKTATVFHEPYTWWSAQQEDSIFHIYEDHGGCTLSQDSDGNMSPMSIPEKEQCLREVHI